MEIDAVDFGEEIDNVKDDLRYAFNENLRHNKGYNDHEHRLLTTKHLCDARKHITALIEGMKR